MVRTFAQGTIVAVVATLFVATFLCLLSACTERVVTFNYRFGPAEALPPAVVFPAPKTKSIGESYPGLFYCEKWAYKCHSV